MRRLMGNRVEYDGLKTSAHATINILGVSSVTQ